MQCKLFETTNLQLLNKNKLTSSSESLVSELKSGRLDRESGSMGSCVVSVSKDCTGVGNIGGGGLTEVLCGDVLRLWIGEPVWLTIGDISGGGNGGTYENIY